MLDHDDRVAVLSKSLQNIDQLVDIRKVESGRRLIENVNRPAGRALGQLGSQLDPLV